jgi:hypothetical protein
MTGRVEMSGMATSSPKRLTDVLGEQVGLTCMRLPYFGERGTFVFD